MASASKRAVLAAALFAFAAAAAAFSACLPAFASDAFAACSAYARRQSEGGLRVG